MTSVSIIVGYLRPPHKSKQQFARREAAKSMDATASPEAASWSASGCAGRELTDSPTSIFDSRIETGCRLARHGMHRA